MKLLLCILFFSTLQADHYDCMEKLKELQVLKSEQKTLAEKVASTLMFSYFQGPLNLRAFSESEQDRLIKERIRILELELKTCR